VLSGRRISRRPIIFRDRSARRDEGKKKSRSAARYAAEAERSDEQQVERTGRGPSWRAEARPSEQESLERRSRLLGFGQCLAPANFSSPCGRTTVTFFRSKADRILSSEASPFSKRPRVALRSRDQRFSRDIRLFPRLSRGFSKASPAIFQRSSPRIDRSLTRRLRVSLRGCVPFLSSGTC